MDRRNRKKKKRQKPSPKKEILVDTYMAIAIPILYRHLNKTITNFCINFLAHTHTPTSAQYM